MHLAFEYIGDRSAASAEAWDALCVALGMDPAQTTAGDMLAELAKIEGSD